MRGMKHTKVHGMMCKIHTGCLNIDIKGEKRATYTLRVTVVVAAAVELVAVVLVVVVVVHNGQ